MELLKKLGCVFVILLTLLLTFLLRSMPKGTNWNDYKILYIQNNAPLTLVNNIFDQNGIKDYVSLDNQRVPIMLKKNSIEESMLRVNLNDISNCYLALRQNYFYDSTGKYMLYYIPSYCEKGIDKATGKVIVEVSPDFYRPTDVVNLFGDPSKAKKKLGWNPQSTTFEELVKIMVDHDMAKVAVERAGEHIRLNLAEYLEKGIIK